MASFSNTELNATIDEVWDQEIEDGRYAKATIMQRVTNKSALVERSGDKINVTVDGTYSVAAVGSNGAFTSSVITPTSVQLTVNQHYYVAIETEDKAEAQSFYDPKSRFPREAGKAFAVKYDVDLAALQSELTGTTVGTDAAPVVFGVNAALEAILNAANANIPTEDGNMSFIIPPVGYYSGLLKEAQLTKANEVGQAKNVLITGYQFPILGIPIYLSTVLADNGPLNGKKGLLLHKSALAIAFQKNNTIKRADRTSAGYFSSVVAIQSLYGLKTIRSDHGFVINVKT